MSSLKIGLLTDYLSNLSGTEASVVATASALARAGDEVRIYCHSVDGAVHPHWRSELKRLGIGLIENPETADADGFTRLVADQLEQWRPDAVHAIPVESLGARCSLLSKRLWPTPLIGTLTSEPSHRCFWYTRENLANLSQYCTVLVPAKCLADKLRSNFGYQGRIDVISHIVRVPETEAVPMTVKDLDNLYQLGSITRLRVEKGPEFLLAAFAVLARTLPVTLTIYGETPELKRTLNLIRCLGVDDRVHIAGPFMGSTAIGKVIHSHPIFLLSSLFESMPLSLMEILARGRAVVATDVGANRQLLEGLEIARVVPAADPQAMAAATRDLLSNPDNLISASSQAVKRMRQSYDDTHVINALRTLYGELARGGGTVP